MVKSRGFLMVALFNFGRILKWDGFHLILIPKTVHLGGVRGVSVLVQLGELGG